MSKNIFDLINSTISSYEEEIESKEKHSTTKIPYQDIFNEFKEYGYLLLSLSEDKYRKAFYMCYKHFDKGMQETSLSNFRNRKRACVFCGREKISKNKVSTKSKIEKSLKEKNLEWVSGNYINVDSVLVYKCCIHEDRVFSKKYKYIKNNKFPCPKCLEDHKNKLRKEKSFPFDDIKLAFESVGLKLLEVNYINNVKK